jgi:hypothetical protein
MSNICVELAKVQRHRGPTIYIGMKAHGPSQERKEQDEMRKKELCTDQVLRSDTLSGSRVGERKAGVVGKCYYSLEWKVLSMYVACESRKG